MPTDEETHQSKSVGGILAQGNTTPVRDSLGMCVPADESERTKESSSSILSGGIMSRALLAIYGIAVLVFLGYGLQFYPPFTNPEGFHAMMLFLGWVFYGVLVAVHGYFVYRSGQKSPTRL